MGKHSKKTNNTGKIMVATMASVSVMGIAAPTAGAASVNIAGQTVDVPQDVVDQVTGVAENTGVNSNTINDVTNRVGIDTSVVNDFVEKEAPASVASVGQQIADKAMSKQGSPYVWGATGPDAFDCSGLTSWAYSQLGKSIPRTSSAQASAGSPVSIDALQPGDIVSYYGGASHVAIYIGGGKIVNALNEGTPVQVNDLNYMPINNAVRF